MGRESCYIVFLPPPPAFDILCTACMHVPSIKAPLPCNFSAPDWKSRLPTWTLASLPSPKQEAPPSLPPGSRVTIELRDNSSSLSWPSGLSTFNLYTVECMSLFHIKHLSVSIPCDYYCGRYIYCIVNNHRSGVIFVTYFATSPSRRGLTK